MILKDSAGSEIKIGSRVVYNRSGELYSGVVTLISERNGTHYSNASRKQEANYWIHIKGEGFENISKVKFAKSVFVMHREY